MGLEEDGVLQVFAPGFLQELYAQGGDPPLVVSASEAGHGRFGVYSDGGFTYTPAANYSGIDRFTYQVMFHGFLIEGTVFLIVDALADAPTLTVSDASGVQGSPIPLQIDAALVDTDGSESLSVTISGVPTGGELSAGVLQDDGDCCSIRRTSRA